jgi:gliding motility-associated-like protein
MSSTIVMVNNLPTIGIVTNNGPACEGQSITLYASSLFGASYSWEGPNGFTSTDRTPVLDNLSADMNGTYNVTVTVEGCSSTSSTEIEVFALPLTTVTSDTTIELGDALQLNATGGISYNWSPATLLSSPSIANPVMTPVELGAYPIEVLISDANGCRVNRALTITVIPSDNPVIPDLFTPNGDGINDFWELRFLQVINGYSLQIYSRGGLEVFRTENYMNDWDGKHYKTGKTLPEGTYYYVIRLADGTEYKGPVTIKR